MKWFIISALFCLGGLQAFAQVEEVDTLGRDSVIVPKRYLRYEKRLAHYQRFWNALIPDFARVQYAGSVGVVSAGVGWQYGKNRWETDVMLGYLPKFSTSDNKLTMTLRQTYVPWRLDMVGGWNVQPFACGLFFNTVFNDKFWVKEPSRYPGGYYGFSSKVRTHLFVGQRYIYNIDEHHRFFARNVSLCWELSTCDLYLVSAFTNKYLSITDILSLSVGLKFTFF